MWFGFNGIELQSFSNIISRTLVGGLVSRYNCIEYFKDLQQKHELYLLQNSQTLYFNCVLESILARILCYFETL